MFSSACVGGFFSVGFLPQTKRLRVIRTLYLFKQLYKYGLRWVRIFNKLLVFHFFLQGFFLCTCVEL